ncbi:MAG TPA: RNA polymerase sigma factor [Dehalococcoidia bacterium]|nr:RNA polymerase sigma factor [Dehalococcoidia bacterium]
MEGLSYTPGDSNDFERLYRSAYPRLVRTLYGLLGANAAEDCAQEAFERAYKAWPKWKGDAPAEAWLYRIAINLAISQRRHDQVLGFVSIFVPGLATSLPSTATGQRSEVGDAVRLLPPKLGAVVLLRYYHGYSNREIASILGIAERTIGWRLARAMDRLRRELDSGLADYEALQRLFL